ncbi:MAG: TRAP transporter large permease subunit [Spirochaetes bacterium]|jgi:TRAP-type C4-dicarboxylate transport system permease large subunit|nr:TRAP transporter large permease subunit [Spirochaetota bacterium]
MLTGHSIPSIPVFTLSGFNLSESKSGERLVRFFRSFLDRISGGMAVMSIAACAFFTTFTGAPGVTILSLGDLLFFIS